MNKFKLTLVTLVTLSAILFLCIRNSKNEPKDYKEKEEKGEAADALGNWMEQRMYPGNTLPVNSYQAAFQSLQQQKLQQSQSFPGQWTSIGPKNFGGRTLCLAFNPQNSQTIYAGAASGGLWRSHTAGLGANAWHPVPLGFPVIGVAAIAINPNDSNTIYIGTGEVYNYQNTGTGFAIRTTRGTYGVGILKTTDGGSTWTQILPWQLSDLRGVQDIIINPLNPNTVFAATTEGTYRSLDAGATWIQVQNVLMATDINFMPNDTSVMLLASGNSFSSNSGIYRSTNGGDSFTKITAGLPASFSGKTLIDFCRTQSNIVYASIADQLAGIGLYKSSDGGMSWTVMNNTTNYPSYQGWYSHDVAVRPDNPQQVFCAGVDVFFSANSGVSLNQVSYWYNWDFNATTIGGVEGLPDYVHADIHHIYYHPANYDEIYFATDGGIFRTTDNGATFEGCNGMYQTQQFYANFSNSSQDSLFAIGGMQDNATAVYEGNLGWRRVIGGDGVSTAIDPTDDNIVFGESQNLNLLRSDDHAFSFNNLSVPAANVTNFAGPFVLCNSNTNVLYAGRDIVFKSVNGGFNWSATNGGASLDGNPVLVLEASRTNENLVYAATSPVILAQVNLYKTTDGGNNWTDVTAGLPNRFIMDIAIDPFNNQILYAVISGFGTDHIFKSTDGGTTWNASSAGLPDVPTNTICLDPLNPNIIYAGNDLGVFASTDAGSTWTDFNDGLYDATFVMDISVSPVNRKLRLATHGKGIYERPMLPITVGLTESLKNVLRVKAFPNPVHEQTTIYFTSLPHENINIDLYTMKGELVKTIREKSKLSSHEIKLNMSAFAPGIYLLKVEDGEGKSSVIKLVKD